MVGGLSINGLDIKLRIGSNVEKFVEVVEVCFRKCCEVRVVVEGGGLS